MKGFVKFIKNVLWTLVLLGIIGVFGGICYGFYDYHTGNAEKYQQLYTQAMFWAMNLKNKVTGEETEELTVRQVSPTKMPTMELSVEGTQFETGVVPWDEAGNNVILCYGKDIGGDLYIPFGFGTLRGASLYTGNQWNMPDISQYIQEDPINRTLILAEEFLMTLEAGEYFIVPEVSDYQNAEAVWQNAIALIVTEETTFISPQQGFAGSGENGMILSNLQNIQEIVLPFYNLGDDRIILLRELSAGIGNQHLVFPMDPEHYRITEKGNAVVLTKDYLQNRTEYSMQRFQVLLSSGKTLDTGWTHISTVNGEPDWLTVTGPDTYSLSQGGDYVAEIHMGWAQRFDAFHLIDQQTGNMVVDERDDGTGDFPSIDEENKKVIIPESVMKTLGTGREYNVIVKYQNGGTGYLSGNKMVQITE